MKAGQALLAASAWIHLAVLVWVCFLLPTQGDWVRKLESASSTPGLLPVMMATLLSGWLCRDRPPLLITAVVFAGLDGLIWSSLHWL